jgi:hypothetical protein
MSFNPMQDPGNPANPNSPLSTVYGRDVPKRSPNTKGDFVLTGIIVGIFALIIALNFLVQ